MINEIKRMTAMELRGFYGINVFFHTRDKKAKQRWLLLLLSILLIGIMIVFYVGGLVYGLIKLGLYAIVPAYLVIIATILILVFSIFKAGNVIFAKKGYDIISSLPVRTPAIVISRFFSMYIEELLLSLLVMLPGIVVYGCMMRPEIVFYLVAVAAIILIPVLPLVVSTVIGTVIMAISSRMKRRTLAETLLMIGFILVGLLLSSGIGMYAEEASVEMLTELADTLGTLFGKVYPPAIWIRDAAIYQDAAGFLLFAGITVLAGTGMILLVSRNFHAVIRRLLTTSAKHNYQMENLKSGSMLSALYRREMKRYFASSVYVTNTIMGPVMATVLSGTVFFMGIDTMKTAVPVDIAVIPFALAAVFGMMTTTSTSVSMEGKEFWIVKTLPVPTKTLLDSKILLNLSLMAPFYLISEVLLILALRPKAMELLWLLCIPAVLILFAVVAGITVNLRFHSFDWEKEVTVVKQSASAILGGFSGLGVSALCGLPVLTLPKQWMDASRAGICIGMLALTILLYRKNNKIQLQKL